MNEAHGPDPARPTTEFGTRLQRFWAGLAPEEKRAIGRGPAARLLAEGDVVGDWTVGGFIGRGGSGLQFNIFDAKILRDAQEHPERYETLQVRVCGWNVRFNDLSRDSQATFIAQAEALS